MPPMGCGAPMHGPHSRKWGVPSVQCSRAKERAARGKMCKAAPQYGGDGGRPAAVRCSQSSP
eukprot:scaffold128323_cov27-Tisochrysis_lutea.AAC.1